MFATTVARRVSTDRARDIDDAIDAAVAALAGLSLLGGANLVDAFVEVRSLRRR